MAIGMRAKRPSSDVATPGNALEWFNAHKVSAKFGSGWRDKSPSPFTRPFSDERNEREFQQWLSTQPVPKYFNKTPIPVKPHQKELGIVEYSMRSRWSEEVTQQRAEDASIRARNARTQPSDRARRRAMRDQQMAMAPGLGGMGTARTNLASPSRGLMDEPVYLMRRRLTGA